MYMKWKKNRAECVKEAPWLKIDKLTFSLIERILNSIPTKRFTIPNIKAHRWCKQHTNQRASEYFATRTVYLCVF